MLNAAKIVHDELSETQSTDPRFDAPATIVVSSFNLRWGNVRYTRLGQDLIGPIVRLKLVAWPLDKRLTHSLKGATTLSSIRPILADPGPLRPAPAKSYRSQATEVGEGA
jgi:hypothetical protein